MGWGSDLGKVAKGALKGTGKALDAASDVLIDKDAWKHTAQAVIDGPGGKKIRGEDLLNMALDSTMLIPGAGLAGGAARVGARVGMRKIGQEAAKEAVEMATKKTVLRSPINNAIRGNIDDLLGRKGVGASVRRGEKWATDLNRRGMNGGEYLGAARDEAAEALVKKGAARAAKKGPLRDQMNRMALKQEAGIGKKVGFGQSKKRIATNAALTGGINALQRGYDEGYFGPGPAGGKPKPKGKGTPPTTEDLYYLLQGGGSNSATGGGRMTPERFEKVLADFMEQGGRIGGEQIYTDRG